MYVKNIKEQYVHYVVFNKKYQVFFLLWLLDILKHEWALLLNFVVEDLQLLCFD